MEKSLLKKKNHDAQFISFNRTSKLPNPQSKQKILKIFSQFPGFSQQPNKPWTKQNQGIPRTHLRLGESFEKMKILRDVMPEGFKL